MAALFVASCSYTFQVAVAQGCPTVQNLGNIWSREEVSGGIFVSLHVVTMWCIASLATSCSLLLWFLVANFPTRNCVKVRLSTILPACGRIPLTFQSARQSCSCGQTMASTTTAVLPLLLRSTTVSNEDRLNTRFQLVATCCPL